MPQWLADRIRTAIEDSKTVQVKLLHSIPVLIVLRKGTASEDGVVRFFDDIYHYDADLDRVLVAGSQ